MDILHKVSIIQKFEPGELIVADDTLDTNMYILMEGVGDIRLHDQRNKKLIARKHLVKGSFFGGLGLTDSMNRYITVRASDQCLVMLIPLKHVEEQRNYDRQNGEAFYRQLSEKADRFSDEIRRLELDMIRSTYKGGKAKKHGFLFNTPYKDVAMTCDRDKYILPKEMKCPVCREQFQTDVVRTSKLHLKKRGEYFISEYKEIEPLWYDIVVCPHCYYAERMQNFEKLTYRDIPKLYNMLLDIKASIMFRYSSSRTAEEVLNAYLIYEKCILLMESDIKVQAKAAILMAELSRRMNSPGLAEAYYDKAFDRYYKLISKGVVDVDEMQMQQLYIILGKLYERKDMIEEAKEQYKNAKVIFGVTDKRYTNIADSYLINLTYDNKG